MESAVIVTTDIPYARKVAVVLDDEGDVKLDLGTVRVYLRRDVARGVARQINELLDAAEVREGAS